MKLHANAALSLRQRERMVRRVIDHGWSIRTAAAAAEVSERTCSKWVARYRACAESGLLDRSSACEVVANRTCERRIEAIAALRRLRMSGPEIAELLEMRERPGELIHIDVKKLGRIQGGAGKRVRDGLRQHYNRTVTDRDGKRRNTVGWDFVHVAIDDATRLAYAEVLSDERATTAVAFLGRALEFFARYGITVERVMTDNGSPYRSAIHAIACRALGVRHLRTRPYRPQTNGKAERLIRTMLAGWAYGAIYGSSRERTAALDGWLWTYNHRRRHSAIGRQPPISRLNNLLGTYI